jgi:glycine oxidase
VQVIVIGAGVIGCAVAHELTLGGARVRVVDPRPIGGGATHASAGMLAPFTEGHHASLFTLSSASLSLWDDYVERLHAESPRPFHYERSGTLQVATEADVSHLTSEADRHAGQGIPHQWLEGRELREFEPSLGEQVQSGLLLPTQGWVDAGAMTRALADAAQRRDVRFTTERVLDIHADKRHVSVSTSEGTLEGDALVLAAGSWSSAVAGVTSWPPPVKPIRGQLLRLRAASRIASRIVWGSSCYVVPWPDGTTLVGATVEDVGFSEEPTAGGVATLLNAADQLLPATAAAIFQEVRVGLRPKTPDELPIIGPSSTMPHVFHATGHYRNGILLTPLTAKLVADLVLGGDADLVSSAIDRHHDLLALTDPARFGL